MRSIYFENCNAVKLIGDINLVDMITTQKFHKNLFQKMNDIPSPGVLLLDFHEVNWAQDSYLLAIIQLISECQRGNQKKTIICTNVSPLHEEEFKKALIYYPVINNLWGNNNISDGMYLLISKLGNKHDWSLLGITNEDEFKIWKLINSIGDFSINNLQELINVEEKSIRSFITKLESLFYVILISKKNQRFQVITSLIESEGIQ